MRLYKPTAGEIIFDGKDIAQLSAAEVWPYRKRMQMIFQDPYASLNPRMTVSDIIGEPLDIYHLYEGKERQERIYELLNTVGLGKTMPAVILMNFQVDKGSVSGLQEHLR